MTEENCKYTQLTAGSLAAILFLLACPGVCFGEQKVKVDVDNSALDDTSFSRLDVTVYLDVSSSMRGFLTTKTTDFNFFRDFLYYTDKLSKADGELTRKVFGESVPRDGPEDFRSCLSPSSNCFKDRKTRIDQVVESLHQWIDYPSKAKDPTANSAKTKGGKDAPESHEVQRVSRPMAIIVTDLFQSQGTKSLSNIADDLADRFLKNKRQSAIGIFAVRNPFVGVQDELPMPGTIRVEGKMALYFIFAGCEKDVHRYLSKFRDDWITKSNPSETPLLFEFFPDGDLPVPIIGLTGRILPAGTHSLKEDAESLGSFNLNEPSYMLTADRSTLCLETTPPEVYEPYKLQDESLSVKYWLTVARKWQYWHSVDHPESEAHGLTLSRCSPVKPSTKPVLIKFNGSSMRPEEGSAWLKVRASLVNDQPVAAWSMNRVEAEHLLHKSDPRPLPVLLTLDLEEFFTRLLFYQNKHQDITLGEYHFYFRRKE